MRLIDADALKTVLTRFYDNEVTAKQLIDEQPTIEAEPVRSGGEMEQKGKVTYGDDNFYEVRRDIIIHGMRMPRTCIECLLQFGGLCFAAPAEVDDTWVAPTVDECKGRAEWCPLELAEDVEMKCYEQGRKDEAAIREGRLCQSFNPD